MPANEVTSPALIAALEAEAQVSECLHEAKTFLLEAGAGAGKTFSLVEALKKVLNEKRSSLLRNHQRIACITYTNVATKVISERIDGDPLIFVDTIHAFFWSLIRGFQPVLRGELQTLDAWQERLAGSIEVKEQMIEYDLGFRKITDRTISLHHDDVLNLASKLLAFEKFRSIVAGRYPYVFIDEYQDTNREMMNALKGHLFGRQGGPIIGLFGDHWQRIYDKTCGHVSHPALNEIGKKANFRSATSVVEVLNKMRPALPQAVKDENLVGEARVFHTNAWRGQRQGGGGGGHWKGDLPPDEAHRFLEMCRAHLTATGWDFDPGTTKVLMLTHNGIAAEQGYRELARAFKYPEGFSKKEDEHIAFFADKLELACEAYAERRYGDMFALLDTSAPRLTSHAEKLKWSTAMNELLAVRVTGTVGEVIDHILATGYPRLPEKVLKHEEESRSWAAEQGTEEPEIVARIRQLRAVAYTEITALVTFLNGHTPFATKHSVKGEQFENVLVVLGRGWNKYNFDQFLTWAAAPDQVPGDKLETYERNRNLLYVCCSRPKVRLALLFTQELSPTSVATLDAWFGAGNVHDVGIGAFPPTNN